MNLDVFILEDHQANWMLAEKCVLNINECAIIKTCHSTNDSDHILSTITFDLAIIDLNIDEPNQSLKMSGYFIAKKIRKQSPKTKIIIATMISQPFLIHEILATLKPEAFLLKSEFAEKEMTCAISEVLDGGHFYTSKVNKIRNRLNSFQRNYGLTIDEVQILLLMLEGTTVSYQLNALGYANRRKLEREKEKLRDIFEANSNAEMLTVIKNTMAI